MSPVRRNFRLRQIVRNGNSVQVSIPPQVLDVMRWRCGDTVVVEAIDTDRMIVRTARVEDLRAPGLPAPAASPLTKVSA